MSNKRDNIGKNQGVYSDTVRDLKKLHGNLHRNLIDVEQITKRLERFREPVIRNIKITRGTKQKKVIRPMKKSNDDTEKLKLEEEIKKVKASHTGNDDLDDTIFDSWTNQFRANLIPETRSNFHIKKDTETKDIDTNSIFRDDHIESVTNEWQSKHQSKKGFTSDLSNYLSTDSMATLREIYHIVKNANDDLGKILDANSH